jgi:hypothetical protein
VLSRDVLSKPEVVWNSRNINENESMCPTRHVAPTKEIEVLQTYKSDDGNTASIPGESNGSNLEIHVQDHTSIREKKQPNSMNSGCLSPISYTEAMQCLKSDERRISTSEGK